MSNPLLLGPKNRVNRARNNGYALRSRIAPGGERVVDVYDQCSTENIASLGDAKQSPLKRLKPRRRLAESPVATLPRAAGARAYLYRVRSW